MWSNSAAACTSECCGTYSYWQNRHLRQARSRSLTSLIIRGQACWEPLRQGLAAHVRFCL